MSDIRRMNVGMTRARRMRSHVTLKNATLITTDQAPDVLQWRIRDMFCDA